MNKKEKQLVKVVPNKGKLHSKNKSSAKGTKKEIVNKPNQLIDIDLFNSWVDNLDSSTQESFCSFAADNYSVIEVYLYARFLGYEGSITDCHLWAKEEFKKRNFNVILEVEIDAMQIDISKLRDSIDLGVVKQDMGAARIAMLQKELRANIKQLSDEKHLTDRQGLILAGADRALREILLIFRDDPIEGPLQEASMGVWTKILQEES